MEIKEFTEKLKNALDIKLGEEYQIQSVQVPKNNSVLLQGLSIQKLEQNVAPTIYINGFLDAYNDGVPLASIVDRMLEIIQKDSPTGEIDMSFFQRFEEVQDRICFRIICAEKNKELLKRIPHKLFLDLAICFFYAYQGDELGNGSILIHNTHVDMWRTSTEALWKLAQKNTERIFPWENKSMECVIRELMLKKHDINEEDLEEDLFDKTIPMYVFSNKERLYGASCVLYSEVLNQLAQELDANLFILPSSIHEVILLPDAHQDSPEQLKNMIKEINETQVEPEDVLSDNLYYYDRKEGKIRLLL